MKHGFGAVRGAAGRRVLLATISIIVSAFIVLSGCAPADEAVDEAAVQPDAVIEVTVAIAANEEAGVSAAEVVTSIAEGATAFDALEASGIDFYASDSQYGKYVESVCGVEATGASGWLYDVNGEQLMVGCDECVLAAGDIVTWTYSSW